MSEPCPTARVDLTHGRQALSTDLVPDFMVATETCETSKA
jgi:hypothetical protein